ncbi:hypothetical protein RHSIM_Rhsim01G0069400 [Rhododendron simsii]|uniref:Uncharacterized protein n=1 Tax=Rhododendron simsii TaxID=118357 RepID=A0A834HCS5_RHOSS|nr:hypothetical protein RHSIM_Rhsim01G0069400 [Rhododendron simsii]
MGVDCQVGNPFANNGSEQANFVSNYQLQNNPYSNTYNPGWRNHPNFSWSNSQNISKPPPGFQNQQEEKKLNMEEVMVQFMAKVDARFQDHDIALKNNENTMRSIERTVGQLATLMSERSQGSLPNTTENNPKEQVKAITLRSGKELNLQEKEKNSEKEGRGIEAAAPTPKSAVPPPDPSQIVKSSGNSPVSSSHISPYVPPVSSPRGFDIFLYHYITCYDFVHLRIFTTANNKIEEQGKTLASVMAFLKQQGFTG